MDEFYRPTVFEALSGSSAATIDSPQPSGEGLVARTSFPAVALAATLAIAVINLNDSAASSVPAPVYALDEASAISKWVTVTPELRLRSLVLDHDDAFSLRAPIVRHRVPKIRSRIVARLEHVDLTEEIE